MAEGPSTARSIYVAKGCGAHVQGLDPLWRHYETCQPCIRAEAVEYAALCDRARALGVPTSLDDPATPPTVSELAAAVAVAEAYAAVTALLP